MYTNKTTIDTALSKKTTTYYVDKYVGWFVNRFWKSQFKRPISCTPFAQITIKSTTLDVKYLFDVNLYFIIALLSPLGCWVFILNKTINGFTIS